jgi:CheY-like chemotaxis protein
MEKEVTILIAEDDDGHATLIQRNLKRAGIVNEIIRFKDGQEVLDYLFQKGDGPKRKDGQALLLLLDIRMPKIDGIEVLKRVKMDEELKKMPVMMVTTTDDPREIENCHKLGCNNYVTKPIDYEKFVEAVRQLGLFLLIVHVPAINGKNGK